jgi:hypothetical protein
VTHMDLAARFTRYADDFERAYADGNWRRLETYFAPDAIYECRNPAPLAFRVVGREAIVQRFASVTDAFDRRFDARSISFEPPTVEGMGVSITGIVLYTVGGAPPLRLPFTETATYRETQIIHLEDASTDVAMVEVADWMAHHGDRLRR